MAGRELGLLDDGRIVDSLRSLADATIRQAHREVKETPQNAGFDLPAMLAGE